LNNKKREIMATLSMFYGIIISMFFRDNRQHTLPHIHVEYQDDSAIFSIPDGEIIEGKMKKTQIRLFQAWITLHADELMANWTLAVDGKSIYKIEPLK
jgi:hypothetical protein